jgi:hypothetical protein
LILAHLGQDSVGKSKHTSIIRRLLAGVELLAQGSTRTELQGHSDAGSDADLADDAAAAPAESKRKGCIDMVPQVPSLAQ